MEPVNLVDLIHTNPDLVESELKAGADPNKRQVFQGGLVHPLVMAAVYEPDLIDPLERAGAVFTPEDAVIPIAARLVPTLPLVTFSELVDLGADINAVLGSHSAVHILLHYMACFGEGNAEYAMASSCLTALIGMGADINLDSASGTPLQMALRISSPLWAKQLVYLDAYIDTRDTGHGSSAMLLAIKNGHVQLARLMLHRGALLTAVDQHGANVLHTLLVKNDKDAFHMFVDELTGDEVRMLAKGVDSEGRTTLHYALAAKYDADIVKTLVAAGANLHATSENGFAPIHVAALHHPTMVRELIMLGARPDARLYGGGVPEMFRGKTAMELLEASDASVATDMVQFMEISGTPA